MFDAGHFADGLTIAVAGAHNGNLASLVGESIIPMVRVSIVTRHCEVIYLGIVFQP